MHKKLIVVAASLLVSCTACAVQDTHNSSSIEKQITQQESRNVNVAPRPEPFDINALGILSLDPENLLKMEPLYTENMFELIQAKHSDVLVKSNYADIKIYSPNRKNYLSLNLGRTTDPNIKIGLNHGIELLEYEFKGIHELNSLLAERPVSWETDEIFSVENGAVYYNIETNESFSPQFYPKASDDAIYLYDAPNLSPAESEFSVLDSTGKRAAYFFNTRRLHQDPQKQYADEISMNDIYIYDFTTNEWTLVYSYENSGKQPYLYWLNDNELVFYTYNNVGEQNIPRKEWSTTPYPEENRFSKFIKYDCTTKEFSEYLTIDADTVDFCWGRDKMVLMQHAVKSHEETYRFVYTAIDLRQKKAFGCAPETEGTFLENGRLFVCTSNQDSQFIYIYDLETFKKYQVEASGILSLATPRIRAKGEIRFSLYDSTSKDYTYYTIDLDSLEKYKSV